MVMQKGYAQKGALNPLRKPDKPSLFGQNGKKHCDQAVSIAPS
jgi:hypothetical protein